MSSDALTTLLTEAASSTAGPKLILDAASYAQRVLLQNREVPWDDATAYANHLRQAQTLLKPVVALVPLDRMFQCELESNTPLHEAMTARTRAGFAARALLSDEAVKARAHDLIATAVKTQHEPVVLHLPSPAALLALTDSAVRPGESHDFDDDDAENVAVYYADWLRVFAELGIAGAVFDERAGAASQESYQPILNTAAHYRWPIGLRGMTDVRFLAPESVIPVLDPSALDPDAPVLSSSIELPQAGIILVEIPENAVPEHVLERLAALRAGG